jgi:hypothetical protein
MLANLSSLMSRPLALINKSEIEYSRRRPEQGLLYKTVNKHVNTVLQNMEMRGRYLPVHVKNEFEAYLGCGILSKGFLRLVCSDCKKEKLVAFSCKKRGICPSCGGRRMCDTAAHLVDNVIPEVPVRQWVITFPYNLRYLFAYNKKALSKALEISVRVINGFYKKRGKIQEVENPKAGSVTLIQRFGGSLNLNIHFHILYPDGVFDELGEFHMIDLPSDKDIDDAVEKIKIRVMRSLTKMGLIDDYQISESDEQIVEFPGMAESISSSIQRRNNKGNKILEIGKHFNTSWHPREGSLCSYKDGFSLHAKVLIAAKDRKGLEHLCRYVARPAISNDRLSLDEKGNIIYKLKRPYDNGTTHLKFTPEEFIEKLIALVPPPRSNLTRYHGVLGPHSKLRKKVIIQPKKKKDGKKKKKSRSRMSWAKLLKRVFKFEIEQCSCGGKFKIIASILEVSVAVKIMESLDIEVYIPEPIPARGPPSMFDFA